MSCAITSGRVKGCRGNMGGIKSLYITAKTGKEKITTIEGLITDIELDFNRKFFKYELPKKSSSFEETFNGSVENSTLTYEQVVSIVFNKGETFTRNLVRVLAKNILLIIVEDNNGKYWLLGELFGCYLTEGKFASGVTGEDRNGYTLTFTAEESQSMKEVAADVLFDADIDLIEGNAGENELIDFDLIDFESLINDSQIDLIRS
jgi:hypothetical protein